ncbi:hypothetical protein BDN72DRAFT_840434 [Pluteus cervinus]|uniref:Uncharacterized protein n=1 Tax=Pluteus cervinus TaxID=181527 RepID=A0ACD3AUP5_9AGAR|nr:hypothetical protein BDN72DRAFT_840434 [Pluteus cervinus]
MHQECSSTCRLIWSDCTRSLVVAKLTPLHVDTTEDIDRSTRHQDQQSGTTPTESSSASPFRSPQKENQKHKRNSKIHHNGD